MIKLINVSKFYNKRTLFKNVNLEIDKAGLYSFIGDNGCGKTTLLNIISKFIKPSKGRVINKNSFSFISQKVNLINHLNVKEHFQMFKIDVEYLNKIRLYNKLNSYPGELSQGQKQRLACLLSLYSSSSIIIADEPTSHLDSKSSQLIIKELVKISKKKIVLLVSHDLEMIEKYSSKIYKIENNEVKLVKENNVGKEVETEKRKKIKLKKYYKKSIFFYKKINLFFCLIFFITFLLLFLSFNFNDNINYVLNSSISSSLDYNKFYLKQCEEIEKEIVLKKCFNLKKDKIEILKKSEHKIGYNYDLLLNSLFKENKFNVISTNNYKLKEGRYPLKYNEIIANDEHKLGEVITLQSSQVLTLDKTDIYNKTINFEVVGIVNKSFLLGKDNYYLDYNLIEGQLKEEYLINNKKTLFDYFEKSEFNNYKYILYFNGINISFLNENKIDYLSSSYDYFESINYAIKEINKCLVYLNIIVISFSFYYVIKLIKKKMIFKEMEINFLKSMGIKQKRIIEIMYKEQKKLMLICFVNGLIMQVVIFYFAFKSIKINVLAVLLIYFTSIFICKKIVKKHVKKRISV